ncbi:MAG: hypothetical protein JO250_22920 [Armatimonadetes bacterium]|nr:hypothetical protein [Armatimonadota bacterium]
MSLLAIPSLVLAGTPSVNSDAREKPLLTRASRIAPLHNVSDDTYFWVSDHEVILFRHVPHPFVPTAALKKAMRFGKFSLPKDFAPDHYQLLRLDTNTGREMPLEPFDAKWSKSIMSMPFAASHALSGTRQRRPAWTPPASACLWTRTLFVAPCRKMVGAHAGST